MKCASIILDCVLDPEMKGIDLLVMGVVDLLHISHRYDNHLWLYGESNRKPCTATCRDQDCIQARMDNHVPYLRIGLR